MSLLSAVWETFWVLMGTNGCVDFISGVLSSEKFGLLDVLG